MNQTRPRLPEPTTAIVDSSAGGGTSSWSRSTTPSVVRLARAARATVGPTPLLRVTSDRNELTNVEPSACVSVWTTRRPAAHQVADDLAEALAVALLERRPEALAVVRQDDEPVRSRRILGGLGERRHGRVDAVERLERLDPLGPAVVGELVVVGEVA